MSFKLQKGVNVCSNAEYHSDREYLSSSKLKLLLKDPADFYRQHIQGNSVQLAGAHLDEGTAIHTALLEPELFESEIAVFSGWRKQGDAYEQFCADNSDKLILSTPQKHRVDVAVKAAQRRPELLELLKGGLPEHTCATELLGVPVKARADYINIDKGYILDLKTTRHPAGSDLFKLTVAEYYYQLSAALYCQVMYDQYRKLFDFYFGVYSKTDEQWDVYKASSDTLVQGHAMTNKALITYKKCRETGIWAVDALQKSALEFSEYEILEV